MRKEKVDLYSAIEVLKKFPIKFLQLRWKNPSSDREFLEIAVRMRKRWRKILIINDRIDIALCSYADGVHLGDEDIPVNLARKVLPKRAIIGLSTHSLDDIKMANRLTPDYISFGSIFPTGTKGLPLPVQGKEMLIKALKVSRLPLVAIGGINGETIKEIVHLPVSGISIISGIFKGDIKKNLQKIFEIAKR